MNRYHINPRTGQPSLCQEQKSCPFGDLQLEHYDTPTDARRAYEKVMSGTEWSGNRAASSRTVRIPGNQVQAGDQVVVTDRQSRKQIKAVDSVYRKEEQMGHPTSLWFSDGTYALTSAWDSVDVVVSSPSERYSPEVSPFESGSKSDWSWLRMQIADRRRLTEVLEAQYSTAEAHFVSLNRNLSSHGVNQSGSTNPSEDDLYRAHCATVQATQQIQQQLRQNVAWAQAHWNGGEPSPMVLSYAESLRDNISKYLPDDRDAAQLVGDALRRDTILRLMGR